MGRCTETKPPPTPAHIPCIDGHQHEWERHADSEPDIVAHLCKHCLLQTEIFRTPYLKARRYFYSTGGGDVWPDHTKIDGSFYTTMLAMAGGTAFNIPPGGGASTRRPQD